MTAGGRAFALVLVACSIVCAVIAFASCDDPSCVERGASTPYDGMFSVVGKLAPDNGATEFANAAPHALTVSDYTADCAYDNMEFLVQVDACTFWVRLEQDASVTANVEQGQTCTLQFPQGQLTFATNGGDLTIDDKNANIIVNGTVQSFNGAPVYGSVQLTFQTN